MYESVLPDCHFLTNSLSPLKSLVNEEIIPFKIKTSTKEYNFVDFHSIGFTNKEL